MMNQIAVCCKRLRRTCSICVSVRHGIEQRKQHKPREEAADMRLPGDTCAIGSDRARAFATMKPVLSGMLKTFWALAERVPAARFSLVAESGIPEADFAAAVAADDPDERFIEAFSITGDADDCRRRLAAHAAAGVTDLVLTFVGPDPIADMARVIR